MIVQIRAAAVTALLLLAACTSAQQKSAQDATSAAPQQAQDAVIATGIKAKLAAIDVDSATAVHVAVDNGNVTLSGEARSRDQRNQFQTAARSVGGVKSVRDTTRVNPNLRGARESLGDAGLAAKVMGAIGAQAGVNAFRIHAAVKDGAVTLTGSVPTAAIKTTVLEAARKVEGVRTITDRLDVKS
ncbi:MAG: BON domain-containing protein [Candidatus Eremiobacteraeota bacterium]|nr:BON domain-containing protein [Candidatus Eremiobacteraeota bacterium]